MFQQIKIESDVNSILMGKVNGETYVIKKNTKMMEQISKLSNIYSKLSDAVPEILIDQDNNCSKMEFITFNNPELYPQYQNFGALGLHTIHKSLPDSEIPDFLNKIDIGSLSRVILFATICGYGDYAPRNIMLRYHNNRIHFVLIDFDDAFRFCKPPVKIDLFTTSNNLISRLRGVIHFDNEILDYVCSTTLNFKNDLNSRQINGIQYLTQLIRLGGAPHCEIIKEYLTSWDVSNKYELIFGDQGTKEIALSLIKDIVPSGKISHVTHLNIINKKMNEYLQKEYSSYYSERKRLYRDSISLKEKQMQRELDNFIDYLIIDNIIEEINSIFPEPKGIRKFQKIMDALVTSCM